MTIGQIELEKEQAIPMREATTLQQIISPVSQQFNSILRSYAIFNIAFLSIGFIEFVLLLLFFTFLTQSAVLAFSLAFVFLTFFSYFILRLYFQAQKPEQLQELKERYLLSCKRILNYQEKPDSYISLANACSKLSDELSGQEYRIYHLPDALSALKPYLERFSCWCHWYDVYHMREVLLRGAVEENIKLVKCEPTSLEAHASLANAYIMLSVLHTNPRQQENSEVGRWLPGEEFAEILEKQFRFTAERAIEEFKIINDFAPEDPWVHAQLAYSYHDLQMPLEEIKEYEILLRLDPEEMDIQFRLGVLYFQQGMNAKGLRIYEQLKEVDLRKAEELIKFYGVYISSSRKLGAT